MQKCNTVVKKTFLKIIIKLTLIMMQKGNVAILSSIGVPLNKTGSKRPPHKSGKNNWIGDY